MARRDKGQEKAIAHERVAALMDLAAAAVHDGRLDRAHRYAELAWLLKTTYQLRESGCEGRVCRRCRAYLHPGLTSRVRFTGGKLSRTCLRCGAVRRRPLVAAQEGRPPADVADEG